MWPALARWGRTVSGRQSAVLSRRLTRELAGHLSSAVTGLAFLEGGERRKEEPQKFLSPSLFFFFFFAKVILARDLAFFLSQC